VVANRKRTDFHRISDQEVSESFEIEVRNRSTTSKTVDVYERKWGDWTIKKKNLDFKKLDSNTAVFTVDLKPNEVKTVSYTVFTKW
jgi:hypothetical protein